MKQFMTEDKVINVIDKFIKTKREMSYFPKMF